ncbi:MAG: GNAT family N-acetyltransferase [candidate division WOR-3 bacterium]|nr:MAG: GNAT family N-acetyltransferase [candidate division WOR-3 bacterium]
MTQRKYKKAAGFLIRWFRPDDAEFCYNTRRSAYNHEFTDELSEREITAAVSAYEPVDYIHMAERMPFFVAELHTECVGFFTLKRLDTYTAEIPLIYITLENIGTGIGSTCIEYIEQWIREHWPDVNTLTVDTIIPKYNSGFYKKVGFTTDKQVFCEFKGLTVKALRLIKHLRIGTKHGK